MSVVIAGSASLKTEALRWKKHWEDAGHTVLDYPVTIDKATFDADYPQIYRDFFANLLKADLLFVMNEPKNGIPGYVGAETFAEICFVVAHNQLGDRPVRIILAHQPDPRVQSAEELELWLKLGWISLHTLHSSQNSI
jgi:hypothetical protein